MNHRVISITRNCFKMDIADVGTNRFSLPVPTTIIIPTIKEI
ncbi:MAG: hypothetical protein PHC92_02200 [Syntrophomonadaceae bacterium]|nr:hypothetical protein [Syntrophomonadaceae bacterium]MDD3022550.1 hypothetical protein [Syntrophomonadaceae bacterium]